MHIQVYIAIFLLLGLQQTEDPNEIIYENVRINRTGVGTIESTDQFGGWSSSEFESCDELEEETTSQTSRDRRSRSPNESQVRPECSVQKDSFS